MLRFRIQLKLMLRWTFDKLTRWLLYSVRLVPISEELTDTMGIQRNGIGVL